VMLSEPGEDAIAKFGTAVTRIWAIGARYDPLVSRTRRVVPLITTDCS